MYHVCVGAGVVSCDSLLVGCVFFFRIIVFADQPAARFAMSACLNIFCSTQRTWQMVFLPKSQLISSEERPSRAFRQSIRHSAISLSAIGGTTPGWPDSTPPLYSLHISRFVRETRSPICPAILWKLSSAVLSHIPFHVCCPVAWSCTAARLLRVAGTRGNLCGWHVRGLGPRASPPRVLYIAQSVGLGERQMSSV